MRRVSVWLLLVCCSWYSTTALALINIEITQGKEGALPIAVLPMTTTGFDSTSFDEITQVVRSDLALTGQFVPIAKKDLPFADMGNWVHDLDISQWRHLDIEKVLLSDMTPRADGKFDFHVQLVDVFQQHLPNAKKPSGEPLAQSGAITDFLLFDKYFEGIARDDFRDFGHHLSDLVYEVITGIRGHFNTKIAYIQVNPEEEEFPYSLEISDVDGQRPQVVMQSTEPLMSPAWSQDGSTIAFVSFENFRSEIYLLEVATGERRLLSHFPRINGAPSFSPDGAELAIVLSKDGAPKLYLLNIASGALKQITYGMSIDTEPSYAPDGKSLIFTSNRSGGVQLYRYWFDSREVERITHDGNFNARGSFTPDGSSVVLMHQASDKSYRVGLLNLDRNELIYLSKDTIADESPSLSPNGQVVLYATTWQGKGILAGVSVDGRLQLHLPAREGSVQEPAWSPFLN